MRHVVEAESGDIYRTHKLVYFLDHRRPKHTRYECEKCTYVVNVHSVECGKIVSVKYKTPHVCMT